jgi:hypothetical protein
MRDAALRQSPEPASSPVDVATLLPTLFGVRNVVYSGVLKRLASAGLRIAVLPRECPGKEDAGEFEGAAVCAPLREPRAVASGRGRPFLNGVIASGFSQRHPRMSHARFEAWFLRDASRAKRLRSRMMHALGRLAVSDRVRGRLQRITDADYRRQWDLGAVRGHLEQLRPRLLWSTTCTSRFEYPYILMARELGIPTVASILSFDNLTTRSLLPRFDHYLVWSDSMKGELLELYPEIPESTVTVTGTPQFDFHRSEAWGWSRSVTLEKLGLPPDGRYFLYGAGHESLMPEEPALVAELARRMEETDDFKAFWLLVRLHPQDDGRRWAEVTRGRARAVVSTACDVQRDAEGWKPTRPEEQQRLIGSLRHAEACLNVASTMSLDAAAVDRPVIGVEFSGEASSPRGLMYGAYDATHYRPLVESGGVEMARGWAELLGVMRAAVTDPGLRRRERAEMVARVCGPVDGRSGERVAAAIARLVERGGLHAKPVLEPGAPSRRTESGR